MKIFLVCVHFHSSFGWSIERALIRSGHEVRVFDYRSNPYRGLPILRGRYASKQMPARLFAEAREFKPNLVLIAKGELLGGEILQELRKDLRCRIATWFPDGRLFSYTAVLSQLPHLDAFFSKNAIDLERTKLFGMRNVHFLQHCADRELHTEAQTTAEELASYNCQVAMVGSYYPYRDAFLAQLEEFDTRVWGPGWEQSKLAERAGVVMGRDARGFEQVRVFRAAKININLHHYDDIDCLNQRVFDINGSGGCQLTDGGRHVEAVFRVPDEMDTFLTLDELKLKIRSLLDAPESSSAMGKRAQERTAAHHTYDHRVREILDILKC